MLRVSAILAVAFGLFLGVAEAVLNWGNWQWWPLWVVDYVCVALLVAGAWSVLRRKGDGRILIAGWAFTAGVFWMALAWMVEQHPAEAAIPAVAVMLALAGFGLIGALWPRRAP